MFRDSGGLADDAEEDEENEHAPFNAGFGSQMDVDAPAAPDVEDFFVGDQAVNEDYVHEDEPQSPSVGSENAEAREQGAAGGAYVPFDPRRAPNDKDLVLAEGDGDIMFDYFDQGVVRNWAGPEHWKLRKVVRRRTFISSVSSCCLTGALQPMLRSSSSLQSAASARKHSRLTSSRPPRRVSRRSRRKYSLPSPKARESRFQAHRRGKARRGERARKRKSGEMTTLCLTTCTFQVASW